VEQLGTDGEQGFMHITHQLMQAPPDDNATSLHATCTFKSQFSCDFSYLLPSRLSWSNLDLTSTMPEFNTCCWPCITLYAACMAQSLLSMTHLLTVDWHYIQFSAAGRCNACVSYFH